MSTIKIFVKNKVADTCIVQYYVCGNTDYSIEFDFDAEWDVYDVKTARFVYGSGSFDVVFSGNTCPFPRINDAQIIQVGVYAGELKTTTPAIIYARKSILSGSETPQPPPEDVYNRIMEELNRIDENIDNSVAAALETAKESGEFTGPPGPPGDSGTQTFVVNCVTSGPDGQRTLESVDKSLAEIEEAVEAGKDVYASVYHDLDGSTDACPLSIVIPGSVATFTHLGDWYSYKVVVNAYGFFIAEWEAVPQHDRNPAAHPTLQAAIVEQMRGEMLKMLSDLGLAKFASSDGSVLYTSHDGKIYVL